MYLLCYVERIDDLYAFLYKNIDIPNKSLGWSFFDLESEFLRMGVPNAHWTKSNLNETYEVNLDLASLYCF